MKRREHRWKRLNEAMNQRARRRLLGIARSAHLSTHNPRARTIHVLGGRIAQRQRYKKAQFAQQEGPLDDGAYYNEMKPEDVPAEMIQSLRTGETFQTLFDGLDTYHGLNPAHATRHHVKRRCPSPVAQHRQHPRETKYVTLERNRLRLYLSYCQNEHREHAQTQCAQHDWPEHAYCPYPDIQIDIIDKGAAPESHFVGHCSHCEWSDKRSFSTDTKLEFGDNTYSELYLRKVEAAHELSLGHSEYLVSDAIYGDTKVISKNTFRKYTKVLNRFAKKNAFSSIERVRAQVPDKRTAKVTMDGSVTSGRQRHDGPNGFVLTLDLTSKKALHVEIASRRDGGNFTGNSCNLEVYCWTETLRKMYNKGWRFGTVCHDDKASFDLVTETFCRALALPTPIKSEDINHWQIHGKNLSTEVLKELKTVIDDSERRLKQLMIECKDALIECNDVLKKLSKKEQLQKKRDARELKATIEQEKADLVKSKELRKRCNSEWGKRIVLRIAQRLRFGASSLTYDVFCRLVEHNIICHYAPTSENHTQCAHRGHDWCSNKGNAARRNWISTSQHPLPVDPSGWLQRAVLRILKNKILSAAKFAALLEKGATIFNEIANNTVQKYVNKRKCLGPERYSGQAFRGVSHVNDGVAHHRATLKSLCCPELSHGQEQAIKCLQMLKDKRTRQYKREGNPSKLNKRKFWDHGERRTAQQMFESGLFRKKRSNPVTNSDDEDDTVVDEIMDSCMRNGNL